MAPGRDQVGRSVRGFALLLVVVLCVLAAGGASGPEARASGPGARDARAKRATLVLKVSGLPRGTRPAGRVAGHGVRRRVRSGKLTLRHLRPGKYTVTLRRVRVARRWRSVRKGATVLPRSRRVTVKVGSGRKVTKRVAYGTIANPGVRRAPSGLLAVIGDPGSPSGLVYRNRRGLPRRGAILLAAPSAKLPRGLVARVTSSKSKRGKRTLRLRAVSVTTAVPAFSFSGSRRLKVAHWTRLRARVSKVKRACHGPSDFDYGAHLDEFAIRHASATPWPPQMSVGIAVRTSEHFGPRVAAAGVSCTWALAALGPWQGAIPTPVGPIPVYATVPVTASASVEGSLSAFTFHVVGTHVLNIDLGQHNSVGFSEEGTNQWFDRPLSFSGSASLSADLGLEMGVGNPKAGDFHVSAGLGPKATWQAGAGCDLGFELGRLSVGAKIGPFEKSTPPYSPKTFHLWHGCGGGSGSSGGSGSHPGGGTTTPPSQGPQTQRARIDWDTNDTDVDLHVWDQYGNHAWYGQKDGIPDGELSSDITTGFGPEIFFDDHTPSSRTLTYGLCYYSDHGNGPTDVHAQITDPSGAVRESDYHLEQSKDSVLIGPSPATAGDAYTPEDGWC